MTTRDAVLKIAGLRAGYGRHMVLNDLALTVQRGEWFTLLGPNGSGKSTLLQAVAGLVAARAGTVHVCGHSVAAERVPALRHLGFACAPDKLPQLLTGRQCLEIYAAAKEVANADEVLALAEALQLSPWLATCVDTWSLGTRQKLCVLLALLGNPALIVLDEAFNGLDPFSALILKQHLRARVEKGHASVLLATHSLDIATNFSDKAALLLDGAIRRTWDRTALEALRSGQGATLEAELAAAARDSA